jgi:hypothetical protein
MAQRGGLEPERLLPEERLVRTGPARLRISAPPHWWEGTLVLTSERIFFQPEVSDARIEDFAFWLSDLTLLALAGSGKIRIGATGGEATFEVAAPLPLGRRRAQDWLRDIERARGSAMPRALLRDYRRPNG